MDFSSRTLKSLKALKSLKGSIQVKRLLYLYLILAAMMVASCSDDEPQETKTTHTVLMFFPWGGNTYSYFLRNISQMQSAVTSRGSLGKTDIVVWIANSRTTSLLMRLKMEKGTCVRDTLKTYTDACPSGTNDYTTDDGLSSLFAEIKLISPADDYSLIIGSHGSGAIPRGCSYESSAAKAARAKAMFQTRWWGATSSLPTYCIDVSTLAYALEQNAIYANYIYFDACYMGNVETAYLLRNATHYLMASPAELLLQGSPYTSVGTQLLNNNYNGALDAFLEYFESTTSPYGTMTLIDCSMLDNLAAAVRQICTSNNTDDIDISQIQTFDGLSEHVFFDLSDYISTLNPSAELLDAYNEAFAKAVPYHVNTPSVISMYSRNGEIAIDKTCGLSTTVPSTNQAVRSIQNESAWWNATQQ